MLFKFCYFFILWKNVCYFLFGWKRKSDLYQFLFIYIHEESERERERIRERKRESSLPMMTKWRPYWSHFAVALVIFSIWISFFSYTISSIVECKKEFCFWNFQCKNIQRKLTRSILSKMMVILKQCFSCTDCIFCKRIFIHSFNSIVEYKKEFCIWND